MTVDDAKKKLIRALKRLDPEQGLVGRRNARAAVAQATRTLRAAVDEAFPPVRSVAKRTVCKTVRGRSKRLHAAGYVPFEGVIAHAAAARLPLRRGPDGKLWAPAWAAPENIPPANEYTESWYRRGRKPSERRTVMAEVAVTKALRPSQDIPLRDAAISRIRKDPNFRDAVLAAEAAGEVSNFLKGQITRLLSSLSTGLLLTTKRRSSTVVIGSTVSDGSARVVMDETSRSGGS